MIYHVELKDGAYIVTKMMFAIKSFEDLYTFMNILHFSVNYFSVLYIRMNVLSKV